MGKPIIGFSVSGTDFGIFQKQDEATRDKYFSGNYLSRQSPVLGRMLDSFRKDLGITSKQDAIWFYGLNNAIWSEFVQGASKISKKKETKKAEGKAMRTERGPDLPVDLSLALLCRFYDANPAYVKTINLHKPNLSLLAALLDTATGEQNSIGWLLGRNSSASYRWVKYGGAATPTVNRLASALLQFIAEDEYQSLSEVDLPVEEICQQLLTLKAREKIQGWVRLVGGERGNSSE